MKGRSKEISTHLLKKSTKSLNICQEDAKREQYSTSPILIFRKSVSHKQFLIRDSSNNKYLKPDHFYELFWSLYLMRPSLYSCSSLQQADPGNLVSGSDKVLETDNIGVWRLALCLLSKHLQVTSYLTDTRLARTASHLTEALYKQSFQIETHMKLFPSIKTYRTDLAPVSGPLTSPMPRLLPRLLPRPGIRWWLAQAWPRLSVIRVAMSDGSVYPSPGSDTNK